MGEHEIRSRVIIDALKDKAGFLTGVEIGVYKGDMICSLLDLEPRIERMYGIDPFTCFTGYRVNWKQESWDALYKIVMKKLEKYGDRFYMIRDKSESSWDAIPMVDFVEIDGSHTYHQVAQDIELYEKKVNKGGVLCGHDYFGRYAHPVRKAVQGYASKHGREIHEDEKAGMWWWKV
jgi:hypothetical protein